MSLDDWRARLRTDPRGTVAELLGAFAARRAPRPGVEDFFWRVLADLGTVPELVAAVLGRLRPPAGRSGSGGAVAAGPDAGDLLDLDREHRVRVRGRLRIAATDALAELVRDPAAREAIALDPVSLSETAFARRRRWAEAAALFALEHDDLPRRDRTDHLLARAALRYALGRVLHRVPGQEERAVRVMTTVLALATWAVAAGGAAEVWGPFATRLVFHVREWLGHRLFDAGRYAEAEREFHAAAEAAPATDLALAARMFAANAMIRDGRPGAARELLDALEPGISEQGGDVSDQWEELRRRLMAGLGEGGPEGGEAG